jgi:hypothetical protein
VKILTLEGKIMPSNIICDCGGQRVEMKRSGDWLRGLCNFTGVEVKIPRGVWFQKPETKVFDFIIKTNGNLPEDSLDWAVDENKVKKYEGIYGPALR